MWNHSISSDLINISYKPIPKWRILDPFETEKGRKFRTNAHYEQFLLFPLFFQKTCTADM